MNTENRPPLKLGGLAFAWSDIRNVVDSFYHQVQADKLLKIPFQSVEDWPHHIERLTHFWWIRFGGQAYMDVRYNPVGKHFESGFNELFLERWLEVFKDTLFKELNKEQAQLWYSFAQNMGKSLSRNNDLMILRSKMT